MMKPKVQMAFPSRKLYVVATPEGVNKACELLRKGKVGFNEPHEQRLRNYGFESDEYRTMVIPITTGSE